MQKYNAPRGATLSAAENGELYLAEEVDRILSPRRWTREMSHAWHQNIPDVQAAFEALRAAAGKSEVQPE